MGAYFNLKFEMLDTDELNVTPPLSPSYGGRPAVYTGCVLCQICFIGCLKKNVKREKLKKYLISQPAITCLKLTIETVEQGVKYVQS